MEVRPLPSGTIAADPFRRDLPDLIRAVGTPRFENAFFQSVRAGIGCAHLTAFVLTESGSPKLILGVNAGPCNLARAAGEIYVSRFWHVDPTNRLGKALRPQRDGLLARAGSDEVRRASFRRKCYGSSDDWASGGAQIIERISIFRREGGEIVKVSFHRDRTLGPFGDADVTAIAKSADLLVSLVQRHGMSTAPTANSSARTFYLRAVTAAAPDLSGREAEVCAGIVLGMTSEGIASSLGVSLNTVLTYRKRAYARLGISSQNELMKRVMPSPIVA